MLTASPLRQPRASADELARGDRLRTLLPIFRNTLAALIAVVTLLTILAGLGVQIAPLIAGAGIFGVAIGFGSQTLVKDVLSGVFYMLDDAFRSANTSRVAAIRARLSRSRCAPSSSGTTAGPSLPCRSASSGRWRT